MSTRIIPLAPGVSPLNKTYTLQLRQKTGDSFLQSGGSAEDLMKTRVTIRRWVNDMGIDVLDGLKTLLIIQEDGKDMLFSRYAGTKLSWKSINELKTR